MSRPPVNNVPRDRFATNAHALYSAIAALTLVALLAGCVTSQVEELRQARTDLASFESVVVLGRQHDTGPQTEESFMACVGEALAAGDTPLKIYPDQAFVDGLFPWFEPGTAPRGIGALAQLLERPGVTEKIAKHDIRYLVWIDGATHYPDDGGGLSCAAGPGGGACLGFLWWEKDSSYEAKIWDLKRSQSVGLISAEASGTSYLPAFIVPVPLIARTQAAACNGLAQQIKDFLVQDETASARRSASSERLNGYMYR
jgi:hypothetical protein